MCWQRVSCLVRMRLVFQGFCEGFDGLLMGVYSCGAAVAPVLLRGHVSDTVFARLPHPCSCQHVQAQMELSRGSVLRAQHQIHHPYCCAPQLGCSCKTRCLILKHPTHSTAHTVQECFPLWRLAQGPHGDMLKTDCYGAPLTFAGDGVDHSLTVSASATLTCVVPSLDVCLFSSSSALCLLHLPFSTLSCELCPCLLCLRSSHS